MELTDREASQVQWIYDAFYGGRINADEALEKLEQLINGDE
jgi:uncharacterized membrane protein YjjP (DUF1212 family)